MERERQRGPQELEPREVVGPDGVFVPAATSQGGEDPVEAIVGGKPSVSAIESPVRAITSSRAAQSESFGRVMADPAIPGVPDDHVADAAGLTVLSQV
jgi:hypothetical protein